MKYKVLLLLIFLIPTHAFADDLIKIDFECYHDHDEKYICEVWGKSDEVLQAVDFKVSLPSYITQSEFVLEENDFGSGEDNWISVIFNEPVSGNYKIGTYNLSSKQGVSNDDFSIKEIKVIDANYQEINIDEMGNRDVNKVDNKNYLGIKVAVCAIIILIVVGLMLMIICKKKRGRQ